MHSTQSPIPLRSDFIQSNTFIEPTIPHSLTLISQLDDHVEEFSGKRKTIDDQQATTSCKSTSSEFNLKQSYKKRRLYEHPKEICIQQIRDEVVSTENLTQLRVYLLILNQKKIKKR